MKSLDKLAVRKPPLNTQALWDDANCSSSSLGCWTCVDRGQCGGAHKSASFFDCADYCQCSDKASCDLVCRGNPVNFVERVREIGGFDLMNMPHVPGTAIDPLPSMIPLVEHNSARNEKLSFPIVALPLYKLIDLTKGVVRFSDREALARKFGIDERARVILSGVARDRKIERYWAMPNRPEVLAQLKSLDIALITPPNFSVLTDVPRTDNLHAMQRILIAYTEMLQAGLPAALHINARTERDYQRWAEVIATHTEIQCLAIEFGTGAGRGNRIEWHVDHLQKLADHVGRPLKLVMRGGNRVLEKLRLSFETVTTVDTEAFSKTRCRRKAFFTDAGKLTWINSPTPLGEPIDDLLRHNIATLHSHHTYLERLHADRRISSSGRTSDLIEYRNRKAN